MLAWWLVDTPEPLTFSPSIETSASTTPSELVRVAPEVQGPDRLLAAAETDLWLEEPIPASPSETTELHSEPAVEWRSETHTTGARRTTFQAYPAEKFEFEGTIKALTIWRTSEDASCTVEVTKGRIPKHGTRIQAFSSEGQVMANGRVIDLFYVNNDPSQPVESLSCWLDKGVAPPTKGTTIRTLADDWIKHGEFAAWYEDGTRAAAGQFAHDKESGDWAYWYPNGTLRAKGSFNDGEPDGEWHFWYADGARWATRHNGQRGWSLWSRAGELEPKEAPDILRAMSVALGSARWLDLEEARRCADLADQWIAPLPNTDRRHQLASLLERTRRVVSSLSDYHHTDKEQAAEATVRSMLYMELLEVWRQGLTKQPDLPPPMLDKPSLEDLEDLNTKHPPGKDRDPNVIEP
jgi:hypothetical protein